MQLAISMPTPHPVEHNLGYGLAGPRENTGSHQTGDSVTSALSQIEVPGDIVAIRKHGVPRSWEA